MGEPEPAVRRARAHPHRHIQSQNVRSSVRGRKTTPVGAKFIPADGAFPVKGHSLDSALHSIPDCQKIIKKAVVSRLGAKYGQTWFDEIGEKYQIQFAIMHDVAELYLDTSGAGLAQARLPRQQQRGAAP